MSELDEKLQRAIDYARGMVGKTPSDKDLRDYLKGTLDPRKHEWCTAFLNATLLHAGIEGTPSTMASSFLSWGRHVDPKDVRAGDVIVTGEEDKKPVPGGLGHAAIVTGPIDRSGEWPVQPTISGNWTKSVKEVGIPTGEDIAEYRRAVPSHKAEQKLLGRGKKNQGLQPISFSTIGKKSRKSDAVKADARKAILRGQNIAHSPEAKAALNKDAVAAVAQNRAYEAYREAHKEQLKDTMEWTPPGEGGDWKDLAKGDEAFQKDPFKDYPLTEEGVAGIRRDWPLHEYDPGTMPPGDTENLWKWRNRQTPISYDGPVWRMDGRIISKPRGI